MSKTRKPRKVHLIRWHVIMHGDLVHGFDIIGPFESYVLAAVYCERSTFSHATLIMPLNTPIPYVEVQQ
jgi:hypothetical protein